VEAEINSTPALIRGVAARFVQLGCDVKGFDAYCESTVLPGSGLSSSAAYEVLIGTILNHLFWGGKASQPEIAMIGQYAENVFFGKPCGLMDQMACGVGGFISIDFEDPKNPIIGKPAFDLTAAGYSLCIVDTHGNHADLNEDYASVPAEMKSVAAYFGCEVLRQVNRGEFMANIAALREKVGDRAVIRAMHFFSENDRVAAQAVALKHGDIDGFFRGVTASGNSSFKYLQNVYTTKNVHEQGLSLALCLTEQFLAGKGGVCRVHGGGFAGTIQAFVPHAHVPAYREMIEAVYGAGSCYVLKVRADGAIKVTL
jgi:galactokinase